MALVYRYVDINDETVKYVGIVWGENRTIDQRIAEHKKDYWYPFGSWRVEILNEQIDTRAEAESIETHLISLYQTDRYYNVRQARYGVNKFFPSFDDKWVVYQKGINGVGGARLYEYIHRSAIKKEKTKNDILDEKFTLKDSIFIPVRGIPTEFIVEHILEDGLSGMTKTYFVSKNLIPELKLTVNYKIKENNVDSVLKDIESTIPNELVNQMCMLEHKQNEFQSIRKVQILSPVNLNYKSSYDNYFGKDDVPFDGFKTVQDRIKCTPDGGYVGSDYLLDGFTRDIKTRKRTPYVASGGGLYHRHYDYKYGCCLCFAIEQKK